MKSAIFEKYSNLDFDEDRDQRQRFLASQNTPWTFENLLPYKVNVYMRRLLETGVITELICSLDPQSAADALTTKKGTPLHAGDSIHVMRPVSASPTAKQVEFARPVYLFTDSRAVKIGDIVYEDRNAFVNGIDITNDMIGIRFHNHLTSGIDIYWKGLRIAQVAGDDGTDFMAGSPNSVYLNNERFGFNIDDVISFTFTVDQKKYASIRLIDNWTSDVIIGQTTQKFVPARQDMYSYRVNEPNVNGIRYFDDASRGAYGNIGRDSGGFGPKGSTTRTDANGCDGRAAGIGATHMNLLKSQLGVKL